MRSLFERETPEVKNWVDRLLYDNEINLVPLEGYSVKGDSVTALFERFLSSVDVENVSQEEIIRWITENEDLDFWFTRVMLSRTLNVPLHIVLWNNDSHNIRLLQVNFHEEDGTLVILGDRIFESCGDFAEWLGGLKGIPVKKKFRLPERLSSIDDCLRYHRVPWPGNLDGFYYNPEDESIQAIFEISRTIKYPVKSHNINRYYDQDVYRWAPLEILSHQLGVPLYIIIWSSDEEIIKIHKLREINETGLNYEFTEIIHKDDVVAFFRELLL